MLGSATVGDAECANGEIVSALVSSGSRIYCKMTALALNKICKKVAITARKSNERCSRSDAKLPRWLR